MYTQCRLQQFTLLTIQMQTQPNYEENKTKEKKNRTVRIWCIVLQINFVLYLLCIMTLFFKKQTKKTKLYI